MESCIKVLETPENMRKAFYNERKPYSIRYYEPYEERKDFQPLPPDKKTIFYVRVRHPEFQRKLKTNIVYSSWRSVEQSIYTKKRKED